MTEILVWVAGVLGLAAGFAFHVVCEAVGSKHGEFTPQEQMRERTPWPPPPLPAQKVDVAYRKPEMLALPRGDR